MQEANCQKKKKILYIFYHISYYNFVPLLEFLTESTFYFIFFTHENVFTIKFWSSYGSQMTIVQQTKMSYLLQGDSTNKTFW